MELWDIVDAKKKKKRPFENMFKKLLQRGSGTQLQSLNIKLLRVKHCALRERERQGNRKQ